jgi:hypothetical protein
MAKEGRGGPTEAVQSRIGAAHNREAKYPLSVDPKSFVLDIETIETLLLPEDSTSFP